MNFLEIVNAVRSETSAAGSGVATTVGQTGEAARLVNWVQRAHKRIQSKFVDWRFLKKAGTFTTTTATNIITPPAGLNVWDVERFFDSVGNQIPVVEYADHEGFIGVTDTGEPKKFVLKNDNTLIAIPYPDAAYVYTYDYFRNPLVFTADTDEPLFPEQFHDAIVGRAMMYYGNYESAVEIKQQGAEMYEEAYYDLRKNQSARKQQFYGRNDPIDIVVVAE